MAKLHMAEPSYFSFTKTTKDIAHGRVDFFYEIQHAGGTYEFVETLTFDPPENNATTNSSYLDLVINSLHLILGISYWKAFCPTAIKLPYDLTKEQAEFWNTVYTKGLGEFFYKNSIDYRQLIKFPASGKETKSESITRKNRSLVLLGAGKDSIVTGQLLSAHHKDYAFFATDPWPIHEEIARRFGIPLYSVKRTIDPALLAMKGKPGILNGHIPISAVWAWIGLFAAALYDFAYVVVSNEESANYGNVSYLGSEINHQWSKSYEFEQLFQNYVNAHVGAGITYFSLLRPISEMRIVKEFVAYSQFFDVFTSCNTNFKITGDPKRGWWCGRCPKCAFVFLLLAVYLPRETLERIFQKNLFADPSLLTTYKELLGLEGVKPFECVGTPKETLAAFLAIVKKGEYTDHPVVGQLFGDIEALRVKQGDHTAEVLSVSDSHAVPKEFLEIIQSL